MHNDKLFRKLNNIDTNGFFLKDKIPDRYIKSRNEN